MAAKYQQVLTRMAEQGCQKSLNVRVVDSNGGIVSFSQTDMGELGR
jgi:hypothetical protein